MKAKAVIAWGRAGKWAGGKVLFRQLLVREVDRQDFKKAKALPE